ncbi:MAG: hypothetical protein GX069_07780 [Tissierellia bacterium]|nr:hypothetical protein [Tissierellia bacterium]
MKLTSRFMIIILTLLVLISTYHISYGIEENSNSKKVYILVVNKLTLQDIEKMPNLTKVINEAGFALMNVRGLNSYTGAESFVTINSSGKTYANNTSSQFYNLIGEYKEIYENRIGKIEGDYSVGNIEIGRLYIQNEDNRYTPYIGLLGDLLHENGLKTAIFGNSDTIDYTYRYSSFIPMDSKGLIDFGNVDDILIEDEEYPYGLKTDYDKIMNEIKKLQNETSLFVIDTGDLFRLHTTSSYISDDRFFEQRNNILNDIDAFIGELINSVNKGESLIFIFSPNSGEEKIKGSRLSPLILWGSNIEESILSSATTKYTGIVSNLDIVPTIAEFFGIKTEKASGNKITWEKKEDVFTYIKSINGRIDLTSKIRTKSLTAYGIISIIILLLSALLLVIKIRVDFNINKIIKILILFLYGIPLIYIISSLFNINSIYKFFLVISALSIIYLFILNRYNGISTFYSLNFLYLIIITLDILLDNAFSKFSVLSYDPIIGARYYGLGNEMVGLLLPVAMICINLIYQRLNNIVTLGIMLLLTVVLVGHPQLGANVGGMISFLSASLLFILEAIEKKFSLKSMAIIALTVAFFLGILGFIDLKFNPNPTHLGEALMKVRDEGLYIANNIIIRKLAMNIKLVGNSFWTKVLFSNIIVQGMLTFLYRNGYKYLINRKINKGYISIIFGSIIGFLVNDSGLVLASIALNICTIFLVFLFTEEKRIQQG